MRKEGGLWDAVLAFENLHRAAYQVLRGKRDQVQAGEFFFDLEGNLLRLQRELRSSTYQPGAYREFWISDPKPRLISAAPFRDRVVHHALVNTIEPAFERRFSAHSYACRKGKGTHRALQQFERWARSRRYVLKMDISKFFPSINHELLKGSVSMTLKDAKVLALCDTLIDSSNPQEPVRSYFPGDGLFTPDQRRTGIPIGNLTSQFFGNVFLDSLDHFVKERLRVKRYLRYVDDFCCFHDDKEYLKAVRCKIADFLAGLRLKLNEGKSRVRQLKEGIEFLGFVVRPCGTRLNKRAIRRQRKRMRALCSGYREGTVTGHELVQSLQAWVAHANHGNGLQLCRDVMGRAGLDWNDLPLTSSLASLLVFK